MFSGKRNAWSVVRRARNFLRSDAPRAVAYAAEPLERRIVLSAAPEPAMFEDAVDIDPSAELHARLRAHALTPDEMQALNVAEVHWGDLVRGGDNNDQLWGDDPNSGTLGGNDTVSGDAGNDQCYGGPYDDTVDGNDGADLLHGDDPSYPQDGGNDSVDGGAGNDTCHGGIGNDTIRGDAGNDVLFGDDGNDVLVAADGATDTLWGGNGTDRAMLLFSDEEIDGSRDSSDVLNSVEVT